MKLCHQRHTPHCAQTCLRNKIQIAMNGFVFDRLNARIYGVTRDELKPVFACVWNIKSVPGWCKLLPDLFKDKNIPSWRKKNSNYIFQQVPREYLAKLYIVASCHINGVTGVLQPSGTLHWVCVRNLWTERWKMGNGWNLQPVYGL